MRPVWSVADSIVSPLGFTSAENYAHIRAGRSGVRLVDHAPWSDTPFFASAMTLPQERDLRTRFEWIGYRALEAALTKIDLPKSKTLFILSTTKGNVDLLDNGKSDHPGLQLSSTAKLLAENFGFENHYVVSNACISGVLALLVAKRFIEAKIYDHAVVLGADVLSRFVVSGFQSLQAMSPAPCRPFDVHRAGINLGEAAAAMVLSAKPDALNVVPKLRLSGGSVSNDANHISGPSRTGEELAQAIQQALRASSLEASDIDFISAHGTATLYNDEMEAKAFNLAQLGHVPLHSLKGYYGHTLGAAGILETVVAQHSLLHNEMIPSYGFEALGVSKEINVCRTLKGEHLKRILKTASGFGGCNAALVIEKENTQA